LVPKRRRENQREPVWNGPSLCGIKNPELPKEPLEEKKKK